ncbi:NPXTG-anchored protein [Flavobacterium suncheonense]|nr:NPXTG-anchored protein [Flavobacterium suncheonense]
MTELINFEDSNPYDSWFRYEFEPYYERVFGSTNYLLSGEFPLDAINYRVSKMCAYKAYVLTNPNGFKPNAHAMQISKVNELLKPFEDKILSFVAESNQPIEKFTVRVSTSQFKYDPINVLNEVSVDCDNFRFVTNGTVPQYPLNESPVTTTTVQPAPSAESTIKVIEPTNTGSGGIIIGGIALAGLLLFLARKKNKNN